MKDILESQETMVPVVIKVHLDKMEQLVHPVLKYVS